jgi:hypothetical protein
MKVMLTLLSFNPEKFFALKAGDPHFDLIMNVQLSPLVKFLVGYQATTITHSTDLKCGQCIKGGYNFCFKGNDSQQFNNATDVESECCSDTTCAKNTDTDYTCSSIYSDTDYALTMCPFKKSKCGSKQNVTFEN